jgi:predicted GH43/DUF377 family glycosyl hydrolase
MIKYCLGLLILFQIPHDSYAQSLDFQHKLLPAAAHSRFTDPGYFVWCGSMVKGDQGKYYLFYSRWPAEKGFQGWVTDSEIALAVSEKAEGPYKPLKVILPKQKNNCWDRDVTHNPTIHKFEGKYYLYYMGNYGNGEWWDHRNHQRIGVAVSDSPEGFWQRSKQPVIDVSAGKWDHLMTSNPAVCKRLDGTYMMVYKGVGDGKMPFGGKVLHGVATANRPDGPFVKHPDPIFDKEGVLFPAEDPYIWTQSGNYYAIVKDQKGYFTNAGRSLCLFESADGFDWKPALNPLVSTLDLAWEDGTVQHLEYLERPQLFIENGLPKILFCAARQLDGQTFNVAIPIRQK